MLYCWSFPCDFSILMRPFQFNIFSELSFLEIKLSDSVKFRFIFNLNRLLKYSDVPRPCSWLFPSKIQEQKYKQEQRNKNKYKVISYHRMLKTVLTINVHFQNFLLENCSFQNRRRFPSTKPAVITVVRTVLLLAKLFHIG